MARLASAPDIDHTGEPVGSPQEQAFRVHKAEYADMCPYCAPRIQRNKNIAALFKSLKEFGYSTLTHDEVVSAYDSALAGNPPEVGNIISMMVHRQMAEAGLIEASDG